jgi:xanthine dehydrogenase YagT iron-sulfur-binding subunit
MPVEASGPGGTGRSREAGAGRPAGRSSGANGLGAGGRLPVRLLVNGRPREVWVEPRRTLLDCLRLDLGLTGTKRGCDYGNCGACTVHVDGRAVYACLLLAVACEGREVTTIEGLGRPGALDPVQQAFVEHDALQCGYCTPGQIMAAKALLEECPNPTAEEVRVGLSGNLCRCGAYPRIVEATLAAARRLSAEAGGAQGPGAGER